MTTPTSATIVNTLVAASASDVSGTATYLYDEKGDETEIVQTGLVEKTLSRHYDDYGRNTGYSLDGARQITVGYDGTSGRIASADIGGIAHTWSYLESSDLKSRLDYGTVGSAEWLYEPNRDLLTQVRNSAHGSVISQYDYTNDAAGRRTSKNNELYGYNERSELISATGNGTYSYVYDDIGNRITSREPEQSFDYVANSLNQYTSLANAHNEVFAPLYDLDGNQTLIKTKTGIWFVAYNGENRPISWSCGATNIVMRYDRMGRRVEYLETVTDDSTVATNKHQRFVYDNYLCVERHSVTNCATVLTDVFLWDPAEPIATRPLQWRTSSGTHLYFHDGNKNVTDVVSVSAAADIAHYDYAPFGESDSFVETEANPWMFSSEYVDVTVATMYYNYRHYDLFIGRWLTTDPFVNSKLYNFVSNAPLIIFDTLGAYGNPVSGPNGPVGPSGPYEPSGCMDSTSLRADCDKLENELLLMCPNIGTTYRTAWGSCCSGLDCREQAKQIADSVYDIVSQMQSDVIAGGWIGNLFSYFGHGYGCVDWQKAVVDAVNDSVAEDTSCFKGIGVGSFYPFTELTIHNWTKIFGPDTPYLLNTYIQNSNGVEIDPWPSGGQNIFPESFRDIDKPTYWR